MLHSRFAHRVGPSKKIQFDASHDVVLFLLLLGLSSLTEAQTSHVRLWRFRNKD
jgi:hypothetical protein